jgi:hypothetical protein
MTPKVFSDDQLRHKDIDTLKRYLRYKLGGYRVALGDITTDNVLYRGVRWLQRPGKIDDVSYPPAHRVTKLGRINRIGESVFYCSRAAPAVFYELRARPGDLIALSEWGVTEPLWMHNLGYHQDALRKMGGCNVVLRPRFSDPIPNEPKTKAQLRRQLSLAFTEDIREGQEYRYKQSIAINELLFDGASPLPTHSDGPRSSRAAGTVYPALQMRGAADNVAIWPEFVDRTLRLKSIRYVLVEAADEARSSYTFLTVAMSNEFSGSGIVWRQITSPENERRSHIALEDGNWILRDGFNRIYDLH